MLKLSFLKILTFIFLTLFVQYCAVVEVSQLDPQNFPNNGPSNLSFEDDIFPIFSDASVGQRCTNCHFNGTTIDVNGLILQEGGSNTLVTIYDSLLIDAGQGLRVDPSSPGSSLMLSYPAGQSPHIEAFTGGSSNTAYQTILTWIQAGAAF